MSFTATIASITPIADSSSDTGVVYQTVVNFDDSASGFTAIRTYNFATNTTQAAAVAAITADGQAMKSAIAAAGNLRSKVGTVLTI
jgi:hypothetical protein